MQKSTHMDWQARSCVCQGAIKQALSGEWVPLSTVLCGLLSGKLVWGCSLVMLHDDPFAPCEIAGALLPPAARRLSFPTAALPRLGIKAEAPSWTHPQFHLLRWLASSRPPIAR